MAFILSSRSSRIARYIFIIVLKFSLNHASAQERVVQLYNGAAPGSENWNWEERTFFVKTPLNANVLYNVSRPTLTVYRPDSANGMAVMVCPGGGMRVINIETEGVNIARELTKKGITVFILKYRVLQSMTDDPWQETLASLKDTSQKKKENAAMISKMAAMDARKAIRYIRDHASEFKIDSNRVGAIGFSAGGALLLHLSANDQVEMRPDFSAFIYSVYRQGSIPANVPPAFIACATDDVLASYTNSVNLYSAWTASKNSAELHIYGKGGHGLRGSPANSWIQRYLEWVQWQGKTK